HRSGGLAVGDVAEGRRLVGGARIGHFHRGGCAGVALKIRPLRPLARHRGHEERAGHQRAARARRHAALDRGTPGELARRAPGLLTFRRRASVRCGRRTTRKASALPHATLPIETLPIETLPIETPPDGTLRKRKTARKALLLGT